MRNSARQSQAGNIGSRQYLVLIAAGQVTLGARAATDLAACAFFCSQALEHCRTDLARDEDVLTVQPRSLLRRLWRRMAGTAGLAPDIVLCAAVVSRTLALRVLHREHSIMQVHALAQGHRSLDASTDPTTRGSQHGGGSGSGGTEGKRGGYRCSASRQKLLSSSVVLSAFVARAKGCTRLGDTTRCQQ